MKQYHHKLLAKSSRRWLVRVAGITAMPSGKPLNHATLWLGVYVAFGTGCRVPRSLRRHIEHPSWSIDPNYVKFRGHVREGRRAVKRWRKDPAYKLVKIVMVA